MRINEMGTDAELLTIERPCACCATTSKCCCYQRAKFSSGGNEMGRVQETCYCCVTRFKIRDASGKEMYVLHPPTCCCGMCINCCIEGNPCCGLMVPFWIFDAGAKNTHGSDAPKVGKIVKKPKSLTSAIEFNVNAVEVQFPLTATVEQKAVLVGTAVFLNSVFFEDNGN